MKRAADGDRLAAQGRIEQLLDRGIEGVKVCMEYSGCRFHPNRSPAKLEMISRDPVFEEARISSSAPKPSKYRNLQARNGATQNKIICMVSTWLCNRSLH
jgi:hypothetical protein